MVFSLNIIAIINFLLLSLLFFLKRKDNKTNIFLFIILIAPIFSHFYNLLVYSHLIYTYRYVMVFALFSVFLWLPSLYFYVLFSLRIRNELRITDLFHLIPSFSSLIYSVSIMLLPSDESYVFFQQIQIKNPPGMLFFNIFLLLQIVSYIVVLLLIIYKYNKRLKHLFSNTHRISSRWLIEFIVVCFLLYSSVLLSFIINQKLELLYFALPVSSSIVYLLLIYKTITHPFLFTNQEQEILSSKEYNSLTVDLEINIEDPLLNAELIENAFLLEKHMKQEKVYLNPDLNIKMLSEQIGISVHSLSETINKKYRKNFFDFINEYRVEEAKKMLLKSDMEKYTIDSISLLSGFRSRSSFYSAFKKSNGISPGEFQKNIYN